MGFYHFFIGKPASSRYSILFISIQLFLLNSIHVLSLQNNCTISAISRVQDDSCPRFVHVDTSDQGLGDQLQRLFGGIALACHLQYTLLVPDTYSNISVHISEGYRKVFQQLGVPTDFMTISEAKRRWTLQQRGGKLSTLLHRVTVNHQSLDPCNVLYDISYSSCYETWCAASMSSTIYSTIKPILDEMIDAQIYHHAANFKSIMPKNKVNIVWHIRMLGAHFPWFHPEYHKNIYDFLESSLTGLPHQNIFVGQSWDPVSTLQLLPKDSYIIHDSKSIGQDIDLIRHADIVVTTGSSFVDSILWLCRFDRPIIVESMQKEVFFVGHVRDKYAILEGRSIRLDEHGVPLPFDNIQNDIKEKLDAVGVLGRLRE